MNFDILTNEEFIRLATHQTSYNSLIAKEWLDRFKISYPYTVTNDCKIYNHLSQTVIPEELCDKYILKQAKEQC